MTSKKPFVRPGSRAGINDPRNATFITSLADLERQKRRPRQLTAHTSILRLEDLEDVQDLPSAEPLGEAPQPMTVASRMVVFFSPRGGTGATTLAINCAGNLVRHHKSTVVVDMDLQLGSVPVALNIKPERSVAEVVAEAARDGEGPLQSGLDRHHSGVAFVAQGDRIEELAQVTAERLPRFFDALGQSFQYVIVDGLRDFSDHAVATMDLAHVIVLTVTQDVPAVRAASRSLRLFRRLGYGPDRLKIALNRYHKKAPVTLQAIENALGQAVDAVIHNDFPLVEEAVNLGRMLADVKPGARTTRDIEALSALVGGLPPPAPAGGFLGRLFRRRG